MTAIISSVSMIFSIRFKVRFTLSYLTGNSDYFVAVHLYVVRIITFQKGFDFRVAVFVFLDRIDKYKSGYGVQRQGDFIT